jgi:pSer/pThr/pTyr-binding forkhead associated (FHA) protein
MIDANGVDYNSVSERPHTKAPEVSASAGYLLFTSRGTPGGTMSDQATRVTRVSDDSRDGGPDLSRFLAKHHVALVVLDGPHRGAEYPLRQERTVFGRSRHADLVLDDETLSREHAAIRYRSGRFVLEDLGSANGCRHNGRLVQSTELDHGDRIKLGRIQLAVIIEVREPDPRTHELTTS